LQTVWQQITRISPNTLLVAGVGATGEPGKFGQNRVACILPLGKTATSLTQDKHHRWLLDRNQIRNYGFFKQLDATQSWWENTELTSRVLKFIPLNHCLTLCCLICEDLARQDPTSDLVRTVVPNLV